MSEEKTPKVEHTKVTTETKVTESVKIEPKKEEKQKDDIIIIKN